MQKQLRFLFVVLLAFTGALATACSSSSSGLSADPQAGDQALLRVVHASPGAPAVDLYAQGNATPLLTDLAYGETSRYLQLAPNTYTLEVRAAGEPASSPPVFTSDPIAVTAGQKATAIATGLLASTDEEDRFRLLLETEGFGADAAGSARVRVVHAAPDAPAVGIDVGNDGTVEVSSLGRFASTPAEGIALPAGEPLQIGIVTVPEGPDGSPEPITAFTTPPLPERQELFVIAVGLLSALPREELGFSLLLVGPDGTIGRAPQNPTIRALHASPDAPAVDLFAGEDRVIADLAFGQLSAPVRVPPGTVTLDFFPGQPDATRPQGEPAATATTPALEAGQEYLAVATGFLSAGRTPAFEVVSFAEAFDLETPTQARVRAIHASPGTPAVDVGTLQGTTFTPIEGLTNLAYPNASAPEGVALPPGPVTLALAPTGTADAVFQAPLTLQINQRLFAVAAGVLTPSGTEPPLQLILVDATQPIWTATTVPNQR